MKRKSYIFLIITALFAVTGCNLDFAPENVLTDEVVFKEAKTAEAALLGAYTRMNNCYSGAPTGQNNYAPIGYLHLFGDIGTPTVQLRENTGYGPMETSEYVGDEDYILSTWNRCYNAIDYANTLIVNINKYGDYDKKIMAQHIAEAKFIRAFCYMSLLNAFGDGALVGEPQGLGVIMRLTPYDGYNPEEIQERITVKESYDQIIKDLTEALPLLPNQTVVSLMDRSRATKTAGYALLSRLYLYKGSYKNDVAELEQAGKYADSVLNNTQGFKRSEENTEYTTALFVLNETGNETDSEVCSKESILIQPSYSKVKLYENGVTGYYSKNSFFADPEFVKQYTDGDVRGAAGGTNHSLIWEGSSLFKEKTTFKYNNRGGYNNVIFLRLTEAVLTKAEVLARINGLNNTSIELLNLVYKKPFPAAQKPKDLTLLDFTNAQALIDRILSERMKEFAYEGQTRYDFIRTGREMRQKGIPANRRIFPIPEYEIRISYGVIKQNSGYVK